MAKQSKKQKTQIATDQLTPKQEAFCRDYVKIGIAARAYRLHYALRGERVYDECSRMLKNPKISRRIAEIQREYDEESKISREKVEEQLFDIITNDPADMYEEDQKTNKLKLKSPVDLPRKQRNAVKSIKNNKGNVQIEFYGKTDAARILGSWHGWNAPTQVNVTGSIKQEIRIGFDEDE